MKTKRHILILAAALILLSLLASGQSVPQLINYQGRLTNAAGQPLDGVSVNLTFTFYPTEFSATPLLTVTQPSVLVTKGIYNVLIGSGGILPGVSETTLAGVFQNHAEVWMGVEVNANSEMTPRSKISSVGYALKADTANTALTVSPGAILAANIGENCGLGEVLAKTAFGWQCRPPGGSYTWTWMSGSKVANQGGIYGTQGVPGPANIPGSRSRAVSSIDPSGNLWLFGGSGYDSTGYWSYLNDLWKYDGSNWTWMSGSNTGNQGGLYGTKGTPGSANRPGARVWAVSWMDSSRTFWLFGGMYGGNPYNDLWRYDGTNWTWMSGSNGFNQYGVYGTKGTPDSANVPGARRLAISWTDSSDNLWLFGGYGYAASGSVGNLNDLWRWDGANWTWMSGNNAINQYGTYGIKGTPDPTNVPGARNSAVAWRDVSGNLWLFGGGGYAESGTGSLNDLWKYDGTNWTWMSGSKAANQYGVYGTKGTPAPANVPGSREWAVASRDASVNLWIFGGMGYVASGGSGFLNDLWRWDGINWTWMSGGNETGLYGTYGTKGTPGPTNAPGSRQWGVSWIDASGNFWIFGGNGNAESTSGELNDLWRFK